MLQKTQDDSFEWNQLTDTHTPKHFLHSERRDRNMASNATYQNTAMINSDIDIVPNSKWTLAR